VIRDFGEDSRQFLIKQGHQSAVGMLDLAGFDDELAVLSGSTDNVELLYSVMAEVGEDPRQWLPVFQQRRRDRRLQM
jgi:type IV secretory pathway VirB4 component